MNQVVLVLGGRGRIGQAIGQDLLTHTTATVVATGRSPIVSEQEALQTTHRPTPSCYREQCLALEEDAALHSAITAADLVIHCAGPFHHRDDRVLQACIRHGVNYIDVSDHRGFTAGAIALHEAARAAGVTAVVNAGIFPGISNSMVRQGVETFDQVDRVQLNYGVGGSGGAGITVLRTTFLGVLHPFLAWIEGRWVEVQPYSDRQLLTFPSPLGTTGVYWYDMPETWTLPESFPMSTLVTKFGSVPDLYNHLTGIVARLPKSWLRLPWVIEALAQISYRMTQWSDRWSGVGVAIQVDITGQRQGQPATYKATLSHPHTATAAACGVGMVAQAILEGRIQQPGVYPVERILTTPAFEQAIAQRGLDLQVSLGETEG